MIHIRLTINCEPISGLLLRPFRGWGSHMAHNLVTVIRIFAILVLVGFAIVWAGLPND